MVVVSRGRVGGREVGEEQRVRGTTIDLWFNECMGWNVKGVLRKRKVVSDI